MAINISICLPKKHQSSNNSHVVTFKTCYKVTKGAVRSHRISCTMAFAKLVWYKLSHFKVCCLFSKHATGLTQWGRDKWTPFRRRHFQMHFLEWKFWIPIKISLKFVSKVPINNIPALVQIMAWRRSGAKPLSEPMMVSLLTHICVTRPQWVNKQGSDLVCTTMLGEWVVSY